MSHIIQRVFDCVKFLRKKESGDATKKMLYFMAAIVFVVGYD
jgi:hypothetical protein